MDYNDQSVIFCARAQKVAVRLGVAVNNVAQSDGMTWVNHVVTAGLLYAWLVFMCAL